MRHVGAKGERVYSSYLFLTSALDGGMWSESRLGRALPPGKDSRYPLDRRLGEPQSLADQRLEEKYLASAGDRTPAVQSVIRHRTEWASSVPTPSKVGPICEENRLGNYSSNTTMLTVLATWRRQRLSGPLWPALRLEMTILPFSWAFRFKVQVTLQLTVSQPVCLGVEPLLGLMTRYYFVTGLTVRVLCLVGRPIWRGDGCVICPKSVFVVCTIIHI
jgi:hypothetical protein